LISALATLFDFTTAQIAINCTQRYALLPKASWIKQQQYIGSNLKEQNELGSVVDKKKTEQDSTG